jgi:hypothetical protein
MTKLFDEMKTIKEKIYYLLSANEHLRDNDNKLIANIYLKEIGGVERAKQISSFDLLTMLASGSLSSTESIMRCRRKLQEDYPELRGQFYEKKQVARVIIKKQIKTL